MGQLYNFNFLLKSIIDKTRKILMYYSSNFSNYWDSPTHCLVQNPVTSIGDYYLDLRARFNYPGNFDSMGIPLYKDINKDIEFYHPTTICFYALAVYSMMNAKKSSSDSLKERFIILSDWLVSNQTKTGRGAAWFLNFDLPDYSLKSPWISALTQGLGISVLSRAYSLTKNDIYLTCAEEALVPFKYNISDGGIVNYFRNIMVFEEYPTHKTNAVLNGHIFALLGIFDLSLIKNDKSVKELFETGVEALKKLVEYFDTGYWTRYNLYSFPSTHLASYPYHKLHIEQIRILYFLTGDDLFLKLSAKWLEYSNNYYKKNKALLIKLISEIKIKCQKSKLFRSEG